MANKEITLKVSSVNNSTAFLIDLENGKTILITDYNIYEQIFDLVKSKMCDGKKEETRNESVNKLGRLEKTTCSNCGRDSVGDCPACG